jgi:hypothetical protein
MLPRRSDGGFAPRLNLSAISGSYYLPRAGLPSGRLVGGLGTKRYGIVHTIVASEDSETAPSKIRRRSNKRKARTPPGALVAEQVGMLQNPVIKNLEPPLWVANRALASNAIAHTLDWRS